MMITEVIPTAESEYVIFFLLAAYIEATQFAGRLPAYIVNLPITGLKDVETRFQQLKQFMMKFAMASENHHDKARLEIKEALHIFDAALRRLKFLERRKELLSASNLSRDNARNSPPRIHGGISRLH